MDKNIIILLTYLILYLTFGKLFLLLPCLFLSTYFPDSKKIFYYYKNMFKSSISFLLISLYPLRININSLKLLNEINSKKNDKKNIIISNHLSEIDPFILNIILENSNNFCQNQINFSKKILGLLIPTFGIMGMITDEIFLDRNLNIDIHKLKKKINFDKLIFFPEGTCFTKEKKNLSDFYCKKNNLPIYKYHLYPRIKGLELILNNYSDISYIYDFTLIYDTINKKKYGNCFNLLSFINKYNFPSNIYINICKYKINSKDNIKKKLENIYVNKDKFIKKFNYDDNNFISVKYNYHNGMKNFIFINLISFFSIYLFYKSIIIRYFYFCEFLFFIFYFYFFI